MWRVVALVLLVAVSGCNRSQPLTAGGKPVEHWTEALHSPDAKLRRQAACKLGNIGSADPAALPALLAALKDPDADVRRETVLALTRFGPAGREAIPALAELQRADPNPRVRDYAARAVGALEAAAPPER